ncbi:hypothetical protein [Streptomyces sp. WAC08401]|uniref:hypothetical protein n=1 Tax=Streptomyces sp. WAC08401 TaxID=2487413 RepID=UPI000FA73A2E|nr:hypothetical protein [Streptomyces sp. WAC08401]RSS11435.1 hypothetical protein EF915_25130 [Streptomyces sp. WAC08401]
MTLEANDRQLSALTTPALVSTIKELHGLRAPLINALSLVYRSMRDCAGDEWAMEWLGEVWTQIPLNVRALAGDADAAAELTADGRAVVSELHQAADRAALRERYAIAIHDAMEPDLSLVDQEPAYQALIARAAEAAMALADAEPHPRFMGRA